MALQTIIKIFYENNVCSHENEKQNCKFSLTLIKDNTANFTNSYHKLTRCTRKQSITGCMGLDVRSGVRLSILWLSSVCCTILRSSSACCNFNTKIQKHVYTVKLRVLICSERNCHYYKCSCWICWQIHTHFCHIVSNLYISLWWPHATSYVTHTQTNAQFFIYIKTTLAITQRNGAPTDSHDDTVLLTALDVCYMYSCI